MIYQTWEEVSSLRARGEFDRAISVLTHVIQDPSSSEGILRRAYNHLVFTYHLKKDLEGADLYAREAVERFPDLTADPVEFPPKLNTAYDALRRVMFGSLSITEPADARVFLGEEAAGTTPVALDMVRVGEYDLRAVKPGYHDCVERIHIEPNARLSLQLSMERQRDRRWWLYRIVPAALAGTLLAIALIGGGEGEKSGESPLSSPPEPPGQ
jgi:hypothetical protein